jgi:cholesterol transport system auxiliary component
MDYRNLLFLLVIFISSCALGPDKKDAPATYDLGAPQPLASVLHRANVTLTVAPVAATPWLDTPNIYYRLAHQETTRPDAYAHHRWTQSPAILLTEHVRARLAAVTRGVATPLDGAKTDYVLRLELEDFSQEFAGEQASRAHARLRATLIDANTRALRAQKTFATERIAAPNAPGAARALSQTAQSLIDELAAWILETLK